MEDDENLENENTSSDDNSGENENTGEDTETTEESSEESTPVIDVEELGEKLSQIEFNISNTSLKNIELQLNNISRYIRESQKSTFNDIAIKLYTNTDFEHSSKSASQLADLAIERTRIIMEKLK